MEKLKKLFTDKTENEIMALCRYQLDFKNYEIQNKLYQNNGNDCFIIIEKSTGEQYFAKSYGVVKEKLYATREIESNIIMNNLYFPNFKGFSMKVVKKKLYCYIIFDKCYMNRLSRIFELKDDILDDIGWNDTRKLIVTYGIAAGMSIIHRYSCPESIYFDDYLFPKIGNFHTSTNIDADLNISCTIQQTAVAYMSPEFLDNYVKNNRLPEIDVYSFCVILYEIMTNKRVMSGKRPELTDAIPECYRKLIKKCWSQDPKERPTFNDIVRELSTNPEFITENVNEEEFHNYIKYTEDPENCIHNFKKVKFPKPLKYLSLNLAQIDLSLYEKIKNIGSGSFAKVYKIFETTTGNIYACKISKYELDYISDEGIKNMERELEILDRIEHPSIIKFIGYNIANFKNQRRPTIITELISNGSLDTILSLKRKGLLGSEWNDTKKLITIYGIASGMSYLHSENILHRDLKPGNIFMNEYLFPKIGDFGLSKIASNGSITESIEQRSVMKGTPAYLSPEIISEHLYCKAGDVYAFGMIVYEIMTNDVLYQGLSPFQVELQVSRGIRPSFKKPIPKCYQELIEKCWQNNPEERPTFDEIVDTLKNKQDFILDTIEKEEYLNYISYIDAVNALKNTEIIPSEYFSQTIEERLKQAEKKRKEIIQKYKFQKVSVDLSLDNDEDEYDETLFDDFLDLSNYEKVKIIKKNYLFNEFEVREKDKNHIYLAKISNIQIDKFKRDEMIQLSREVNIDYIQRLIYEFIK